MAYITQDTYTVYTYMAHKTMSPYAQARAMELVALRRNVQQKPVQEIIVEYRKQ